MRPPCTFLGSEVLPLEHQVPVEAAPQVGRRSDVVEVVHADDVDDGAYDARRVLLDPLQQRLEPVHVALAVAVQEGEHVGRGGVRTVDSRPHETFPLLVPDDPDLLDLGQLLAVGGVVAEVVHQNDLLDEVLRAAVQHTDDGPEQGGARLVVEGDDDGGGRQVLGGVLLLVAPS